MILYICILSILSYLIFIGWLNFGFDKVEDFKLQDLKPKTKFSVVIPFRNEAKNLPRLLKSIEQLHYLKSHYEVILVDDESDDNTLDFLNTYLTKRPTNKANTQIVVLKNIRQSISPKKDAINTAIEMAKFDWIVTTDADCVLPKYWLDTFDEFIQAKSPKAICGPVKFVGSSSFFNRYQIIDTLSLQGATIGSFGIKKPFLCNGANFAYCKDFFHSVNGFKGNNTIASGDDIFLLQKFLKQDKAEVHYIKTENIIVSTTVAPNFREYIQQRIRWSSKTKRYSSFFTKMIGVIVLLANLIIVCLIPFMLLKLISLKAAGLLLLIKLSIDLLLIFKTARFLKQDTVLLSYFFAGLLYPFTTIYIAFKSLFSHYDWKGRHYKT